MTMEYKEQNQYRPPSRTNKQRADPVIHMNNEFNRTADAAVNKAIRNMLLEHPHTVSLAKPRGWGKIMIPPKSNSKYTQGKSRNPYAQHTIRGGKVSKGDHVGISQQYTTQAPPDE